MKRTVYIMLAVLLVCALSVLSLSACGPAEPENPVDPGDTPGDVPGDDVPGDTPGGDTPGDDVPGGDTPGDDTPGSVPGGDTPGDDEPENPKLNFTGITFNNKNVNYDGESHTITASGIPAGATVVYSNEGPFTDAGNYTIGLTVKMDGYNDYTDTATLSIKPIDFVGVTFSGKSFEYDGEPHSIFITGSLPSTASVRYSSDVSGVKNAATEIGVYNVTAYITDKNHNPLTLRATLRITTVNEERFMACSVNGDLYFQNAMDNDELYVYTKEGSLYHVCYGDVSSLFAYGDGVAFINSALFSSAIRVAVSGETSVTVDDKYTISASYMQMSGDVIYYSVNNLLGESGIYKLDLNNKNSDDEVTPVCLSLGKASYLTLVGSNLYFADGDNGGKLSKINTSAENQTRTLVVDAKINNLIHNNGALYYTVNNLLGNYIEKYTVSGGVRRKLTQDAGESLNVIGDRLYYVNVDKLTASFIGSGIYYVNTNPLADSSAPGTKLIDGGEMGVCSLTTDGSYLYYYDLNGYQLIKYNLSSGSKINLLDGFVKPEDPTPISTGSKLLSYEGKIYYLNIYDGKRLHCYNPVTNESYPLTSGKVADFAIIGDTLYVNMVSWLVNNDTFSVNLKTGGELVRVNEYSAFDIVTDGTYLYWIEENALNAMTAIHRCKPDGTEDTIIYEYGVTNLRYVDGRLYFVRGNNIHCLDLATSVDTVIAVDGRDIHTTAFDTDGEYLYYRDMYGLAWGFKRLSRCKLDGTANVVMVDDVDPVCISYIDGYVYYYSDTTSTAKNGLFKVYSKVVSTTTGTTILAEGSGKYAVSFAVLGDKVYFVDYKNQLTGNAHLYVIDDGEVEKLQ